MMDVKAVATLACVLKVNRNCHSWNNELKFGTYLIR